MAKGMSYKDAGVNINEGNRAVSLMKDAVSSTWRPEVLTELGGFGGLFQLDVNKYQQPVLVSGTDGVGTKLKIAFAMDKHDTIGIDAVAMCVNDILVQGAEPLFFLDYVALGKLIPEQVADVVKGIAFGCKQAGCALIGGETAEMPGFYAKGEYDIAGFAVGVVDKEKIIDGQGIRSGDVIIGLSSSGLHSNGYSLARKVLLGENYENLKKYDEKLGTTLGEEMLKPTKIYVQEVLPLIEQQSVKGMAHITGGGLVENVPRVLPKNLKAEFNWGSWPVPAIFQLIQSQGNVPEAEMYRTFNMGIGFVLIAPQEEAEAIISQCSEDAYVIGKVINQ